MNGYFSLRQTVNRGTRAIILQPEQEFHRNLRKRKRKISLSCSRDSNLAEWMINDVC